MLGFVSLSFTEPTCREELFHLALRANQVCALSPLAFWTQPKFDLGLLSLSLVSEKHVGVCFPQLQGTNT